MCPEYGLNGRYALLTQSGLWNWLRASSKLLTHTSCRDASAPSDSSLCMTGIMTPTIGACRAVVASLFCFLASTARLPGLRRAPHVDQLCSNAQQWLLDHMFMYVLDQSCDMELSTPLLW